MICEYNFIQTLGRTIRIVKTAQKQYNAQSQSVFKMLQQHTPRVMVCAHVNSCIYFNPNGKESTIEKENYDNVRLPYCKMILAKAKR